MDCTGRPLVKPFCIRKGAAWAPPTRLLLRRLPELKAGAEPGRLLPFILARRDSRRSVGVIELLAGGLGGRGGCLPEAGWAQSCARERSTLGGAIVAARRCSRVSVSIWCAPLACARAGGHAQTHAPPIFAHRKQTAKPSMPTRSARPFAKHCCSPNNHPHLHRAALCSQPADANAPAAAAANQSTKCTPFQSRSQALAAALAHRRPLLRQQQRGRLARSHTRHPRAPARPARGGRRRAARAARGAGGQRAQGAVTGPGQGGPPLQAPHRP